MVVGPLLADLFVGQNNERLLYARIDPPISILNLIGITGRGAPPDIGPTCAPEMVPLRLWCLPWLERGGCVQDLRYKVYLKSWLWHSLKIVTNRVPSGSMDRNVCRLVASHSETNGYGVYIGVDRPSTVRDRNQQLVTLPNERNSRITP